MRRAGLDYAEMACVTVHTDWAACRAALGRARLFVLTTNANHRHVSADFQSGDAFVFGSESRGLPADIDWDHRLRLPLFPGNRIPKLSNAVVAMIYEARRQQGFAGGSRMHQEYRGHGAGAR